MVVWRILRCKNTALDQGLLITGDWKELTACKELRVTTRGTKGAYAYLAMRRLNETS